MEESWNDSEIADDVADPIAELKRYAGRIEAVHVKDIAPAGQCVDEDGWADPGFGVLDWSTLVPLLKQLLIWTQCRTSRYLNSLPMHPLQPVL